MADVKIRKADAVDSLRWDGPDFDYPHRAFRSPSTTEPLQMNMDRITEWDVPSTYALGFRSMNADYLPRQQLLKPSSNAYLSQTSEEWPRETESSQIHLPVRKQEICIWLMNKVVLHLETESFPQMTVQALTERILQDDQELSLPPTAKDTFSLWMISPMLELQLTSHQKPFQIRQQWVDLLLKYTSASTTQLDKDEPQLYFKRNVFCDKQDEMRICDMKILELLYEEAKQNILNGRYICDIQDCNVLAGLQARLELGPFNPQVHTAEFFRSQIHSYLPSYARKKRWSLLRVTTKPGPEHRLLDRYRSISASTTRYKLLRKYLEFCWALPYYGSAFFKGQVEKPVKGISTLLDHYDIKVLVGVNREGVHIINKNESIVLLTVKYKHLSWDFSEASDPSNPDCLPCLFLHFTISGDMSGETKLIQVFSRQAKIMDHIISKFVQDAKQRPSWNEVDQVDRYLNSAYDDGVTPVTSRKLFSQSSIDDGLKRLSLTTLNESGKPLNYTKSWPFM